MFIMLSKVRKLGAEAEEDHQHDQREHRRDVAHLLGHEALEVRMGVGFRWRWHVEWPQPLTLIYPHP
jgi:hypothetical protein